MLWKKILCALLVLLVCCGLSIAAEKALDQTADRIRTEVSGEQIYQLFPNDEVQLIRCRYREGVLSPSGEDPQMVWRVDPSLSLYDLTVRFSAPLEAPCDLQLFYDTGTGFSQEESVTLKAQPGDRVAAFPLEPGAYYNLRLDVEEPVPLEAVDCGCQGTVVYETEGAFRLWRCGLLFLLLLVPGALFWLYHFVPGWQRAIRRAAGFLGSDPVWYLLVSTGLSVWLTTYARMETFTDMQDVLRTLLHPNALILVVLYAFTYGGTVLSRGMDVSLWDWLYRWRWAIAAAAIVLGVAMEISGSSLHLWADYMFESENNGVLLGTSRAIRSDEWAHSVPMLSALDREGYPFYSTLLRASPTETVLTSGKTAWDFSAVYRPFTWGYLLLGLSRGISFDWVARFVLVFMLSFDLGMLMLKNRKLALALACSVLFSPAVQWWFYTPLTDMLVCGFAMILAGKAYLLTEKVTVKLLTAAVVLVSAGNYVLTLYPAWVVPFAYLILGVFIWVVTENRKDIRLRLKPDLPLIGGALLLFGISMLVIFRRSAGALYDMTHTVYPGTDRVNVPLPADSAFSWILNLFSPFTDAFTGNSNVCETAGIMTFFPMGLLLSLFAMIRRKKADLLCVILWILSGFFAAFTFLDVPDWLRKITLMSYSMSGRIAPCFALTQLLLLFRGAALLKDRIRPAAAAGIGAVLALLVVGFGYRDPFRLGVDPVFLALFMLCLAVTTVALLTGWGEKGRRLFAGFMVMVSLTAGGWVNPVRTGTAEITDSPLLTELREITDEDPSGKWLVENLRYPYAMLPLMAGAPTINGANNYPDLERWRRLDPEQDDEVYYNRYVSQITVNLVEEETRFLSGDTADQFALYLNPADLARLEVSYLFSNQELEGYSTDRVTIEKIMTEGLFRVYRVRYKDGAAGTDSGLIP